MNQAPSNHKAGLAITRFLYTINPVLPLYQVFSGDIFKYVILDPSFIMYLNNRNLATGLVFYQQEQELPKYCESENVMQKLGH